MSSVDIHSGDWGTTFSETLTDTTTSLVIDLTAATGATITFQLPDGSTIVRTATIPSPKSSGVVRYTTVAGDVPYEQYGTWYRQFRVTLADGAYASPRVKFEVLKGLQATPA